MSVGILFKTRGVGEYPEMQLRSILNDFLTTHNFESWTLFINQTGGDLMIESVSSVGRNGSCLIPLTHDAPRKLRAFLEGQLR